jgi:hypothetical protein
MRMIIKELLDKFYDSLLNLFIRLNQIMYGSFGSDIPSAKILDDVPTVDVMLMTSL